MRTRLDPSRDELAEEIQWLATARHELVVFYFSGHAKLSTQGGAGLMLRGSEAARSHTLLAAQDVGQALALAEGCTIVLILDCCFAEDLASDIRSQLGWKPDGLICLLSSQTGMLTIQPATVAKEGEFLYSECNSIFTRSILLALAGLASASSDLDLVMTTRLAHFESIRLGANAPTLMSQGLSSHFAIPTVKGSAADATAPRRMMLYGAQLGQRAVGTAVKNVAVRGSLGALADEYSSWLAGARVSHHAFAQGPATFSLSSMAPEAFGEISLLRDLDRVGTLNYVASIRAGRIIASVGPEPAPQLLEAFDQHASVPKLEPGHVELAMRRISGAPLSRRVVDALDAICELSGDSLERGVTAGMAVSSFPDAQLGDADILRMNEEALSRIISDKVVAGVFEVLFTAPNIDLSVALLTDFLSEMKGVSKGEAADAVEQVRRAGWVTGQRSTVWMPPAVREFVRESHRGILEREPQFEGWLDWGLATTGGFRRRQVFGALCAAIEDRKFRSVRVVDALQRAGRELAYWTGPLAATSLFGDVLSDPEYGDAPLLWLRLGDARRLMDDYLGAREAFDSALDLSVREVDRSEAKIGIASAVKNLDGGTEQLDAALKDLGSVSGADPGTPQVAARALFQQGNLLFSSSRWVDALDSYALAEELLDRRDWTSTSLLLDIWKGEGDVFLHMGEVDRASGLLTLSLDLAGVRATTGVDGRAHAKLSQFAGDVWRHGMIEGGGSLKMAGQGALWWYSVAESVFSANGLELGILITRFRRAQVVFGLGQLDEALSEFLRLKGQFATLGNALWELKSDVMICLIIRESKLPLERLGRRSLQNLARHELDGKLSRYQAAWVGLAMGHPDLSIDGFRAMGALRMADRLHEVGPGVWLGSEY